MAIPPRTRSLLRACAALAAAAWLAFVAHTALGLGGHGLDSFFNSAVYNVAMAMAAAVCLARAVLIPAERAAWAAIGLGLTSWTLGEVYWSVELSGRDDVPVPSYADALYLGLYPTSYVGLVLLVRSRVGTFARSAWLDGAIAGLAVAALGAAVVFPPILGAPTADDTAGVATNLAYPIGDLVLLALVIWAMGASRWRPDRTWVLLGAGFALSALVDVLYLIQSSRGTYVEGTVLDALWPGAALLVALAAWQPVRRRERVRIDGVRAIAIPALSALAATVVTAVDHFNRLNHAAAILGTTALGLVTARLVLAFLEKQQLLGAARREALTDALTGLRNRRRLMDDLGEALAVASPSDPRFLVLLDLNGFKDYNDTFGHPAGDQMLARLGRRLQATVRGHGHAYRLGGDEFCALLHPGAAGPGPLVAAASSALAERGEGFDVHASFGHVELPLEAMTVSEALLLADRRMYASKGGTRASVTRQTRDVLLTTLQERQPDLRVHLHDVADLALAVGRRLGMSAEELDETARAAELHDVGKVAIPDAILNKPAPPDAEEWEFMRRHTIVGERILSAAPALMPVARLVRYSHERWDGNGYPDGLAGEEIPLGARVVAVCDAFDAMVTRRPYRTPVSDDEALEELRRCSGTQFDPRVVDAFCTVMREERPETRSEHPAER